MLGGTFADRVAGAPAPVGSRASGLVIIPAYNEVASLPRVLAELRSTLPELDVLVVSDGSTDETAAVGRAAGVAVVELPFNLGIGGALRTGFRYAVDEGYGTAVQFDADGQHDPTTVQRLLHAVKDGADLVIGSRFMEGGTPTYHISRLRRLAMRALEWIVWRLVGRRFTDTSSGLRGFSAPMLMYFAEHYPVEYMDSVEALVMASNAGFDVREVPAGMLGRMGGAPSTRGWRLAYYYVRLLVVLLTSYTRPAQRHRTGPSDREPPMRDAPRVVERLVDEARIAEPVTGPTA
jgi:glycosyltransferase involved in cell wall biosynthesis